MITASDYGKSVFNLTFRRIQQTISHSSTTTSQLWDTITLIEMLSLGLMVLSGQWTKNENNRTISSSGHSDGMNTQTLRNGPDSGLSWRRITKNLT